jgi:hypothetical protein
MADQQKAKAADEKSQPKSSQNEESTETKPGPKASEASGPAPANQEDPNPKPTTNQAEAAAAEKSAQRDAEDPNAQTGGTGGARKGSRTAEFVGKADGEGYVENPDFIPNPSDHYGYLDTTGAGVTEDKSVVNPYLVQDSTVVDTLPEADKERVTKLAPDYAADGSRIVRPDSV